MTEKALLGALMWAKLFDHILDEATAQAFMNERIELETLREIINDSKHIVKEGDLLRTAQHEVTKVTI